MSDKKPEALGPVLKTLIEGKPLDRPPEFQELARRALLRKERIEKLKAEGKWDTSAWAQSLAKDLAKLTD